jgi:hypothetical protein
MGEQERILQQGQLMLLDSETMQPKHPVYVALLTNNLLVGHPSIGGGGAPKHPFHMVLNLN